MNYLERDTYGIYSNNKGDGPGPRLMGAETLIGNDVYSRNEKDIGDIKEIMLDTVTGEICYAVLSYGGFLGMGEKLFAVPWEALTLDTENKRFILDIDSSTLESAPGFDKDNWPNMADESWALSVHDYYGTNLKRNISQDSNTL